MNNVRDEDFKILTMPLDASENLASDSIIYF